MHLGVRELAGLLNLPEQTIYRWASDGSLPAQRIGDQHVFHPSEVLEWAAARGLSLPAAAFAGYDSPAEAEPALCAALRAGGIHRRVPGGDREAVLAAAVGVMRLPPSADRQELLRVLLAREALASTAIGEGIAIPHVRNPIVLHVDRPAITLCFLEQPVDFGALDGKPVQCLFAMVSPTVRAHLQVLARLMHVLQAPGFRAALVRRAPDAEILAELERVEAGLQRPRPPAAAGQDG